MNHFQPPLDPKQVITNHEICEIFKVAPRGGMRRSKKTNTLVLISDPTRDKYSDRWEGNTLHYTGMGLMRDQSLTFQQNKTLNESNLIDIDVHLFEVKTKGNYIYRGQVYLSSEPYQEKQVDDNGNLRNVWMFPIKLIESKNQQLNDKFIPAYETNSSSTGYWTFFCNPKRWEIDRFLETNIEYDIYQVTEWQRHLFKPGQLGVIRVGNDSRSKTQLKGRKKLIPGVYAIVEIVSEAMARKEKADKFWLDWKESTFDKPVVQIRYLKNLISNPLTLKSISNNQIIESDKYLLKGFQTSSMPLRKDVFEEIINLLGEEANVFENIEPIQVDTFENIKSLEEKFQSAAPQVKEVISKRIERGPLAQKVKKMTGFKCLICESLGLNPYVFKKSNYEYYIETHHVIQVSEKERGLLGLNNLITLCPNHHRQVHYGDTQLIDNNNQEFVFRIDGKDVVIKKILLQ